MILTSVPAIRRRTNQSNGDRLSEYDPFGMRRQEPFTPRPPRENFDPDAALELPLLCAKFGLDPVKGKLYIRNLAHRGHVRVLGVDPQDKRKRLYSIFDLARWFKEHPHERVTV